MVNEEDVRVRLGLDLTFLRTGFDKAKIMAEEWGKEFHRSLNEAGKSLLAPLTGAGALEGLSKIVEKAEQISRVSEGIGIDAEKYQRLAYSFQQVGVDSDAAEKQLQKLAVTVGEAREGNKASEETLKRWSISLVDSSGKSKETGTIIDEVAERMSNMTDETEKAAMANDLFGRGALKAIDAMKEWNKTKGAGASVMSTSDINSILEAKKEVTSMFDHFEVGVAHLIGMIGDLFYRLGKLSVDPKAIIRTGVDLVTNPVGTMFGLMKSGKEDRAKDVAASAPSPKLDDSHVDKPDPEYYDLLHKALQMEDDGRAKEKSHVAVMLQYQKEAAALEDKILGDKKESKEQGEDLVKLAELHNKMSAEKLQMDKESDEHQKSITQEKIKQKESELYKAREQAKSDSPYFHTVEELSHVGLNAPAYNVAREIMARQQRLGNYSLLYGVDSKAREEEGIIKNLKSQLEAAGFISPEQHLEAMRDGIESLVKKASAEGLNVNPMVAQ